MEQYINRRYDKTIKFDGHEVDVFSRDMLDDLYPSHDYRIVGETIKNNKKDEIDELYIEDNRYIVSELGGHGRILNKRAGYVQVGNPDEKIFVLILKSRAAFVLLLLGMLLAALVAGAAALIIYLNTPVIAADYPLPDDDPNAKGIGGDNTQKPDTPGGSVTMRFDDKVNVDLATGHVECLYQNPQSSNQDCVITLCIVKKREGILSKEEIEDEYPIARSGLVRYGKELRSMTLMPDHIALEPGVYKGRFKIDAYNRYTGERAQANAQLEDIELMVR